MILSAPDHVSTLAPSRSLRRALGPGHLRPLGSQEQRADHGLVHRILNYRSAMPKGAGGVIMKMSIRLCPLYCRHLFKNLVCLVLIHSLLPLHRALLAVCSCETFLDHSHQSRFGHFRLVGISGLWASIVAMQQHCETVCFAAQSTPITDRRQHCSLKAFLPCVHPVISHFCTACHASACVWASAPLVVWLHDCNRSLVCMAWFCLAIGIAGSCCLID